MAPTIIRRTSFLLITRITFLEVLFMFIFLIFRVPAHIINIDRFSISSILLTYLILYIILSLFKITILIIIVLKWMNDYYEVIPGTLLSRSGIFSTTENTFSLDNIEMEEIKQSFLGRIFHYGSLEIYNPLIKQRFYLTNIPYPKKHLALIKHYSKRSISRGTKIIPFK